jgi:hypothetical protein
MISGRDSIEHGVAIPTKRFGLNRDLEKIGENGSGTNETKETIYRYLIERAKKEPGLLEILLKKPELRVKVERQTIHVDGDTIQGMLARLLHEGFFKIPKSVSIVQKELKRRGNDQPTTNIYKPLNKLTGMGFLTLESEGYKEVSEMKVNVQSA